MRVPETIYDRGQDTSADPMERIGAINDGIYADMRLDLVDQGWNREVQKVVVVLSASRSGSSLVFKALSDSPDVVAPAGEHEPWLFLSGNKHPFNGSDELTHVANQGRLLHLLRNDMLVRESEVTGTEFGDLLWNRLAVRQLHGRVGLRGIVDGIYACPTVDKAMHQEVINQVNVEAGELRPATKVRDIGNSDYFLPIENPPYIDQPLARRATIEELSSKTLLFKSPEDAYRPGFYESLFPNATITYLHLTRGFAQTVNGLMDGWSKNDLDFMSNAVGLTGQELAIPGYSGSDITKNYWCFDLFPGWEKYRTAALAEICVQQWLQAHKHIAKNFPVSDHVTFESFYADRDAFNMDMLRATGIDLRGYDWSENVMSTDPPSQFRWLKRERLFRNIDRYLAAPTVAEIIELQEGLGYSMETSTWH